MKTEKEIIVDKDLVFTEMQKIRNGRPLGELPIDELIEWVELKGKHEAYHWVLM